MILANPTLTQQVLAAKEAVFQPTSSAQFINLIDLTSLNAEDTEKSILNLCHQAQTPLGNVAAVCVYPQFVATAKAALANTSIKIATVANFPQGNQTLEEVKATVTQALEEGAQEIDLVIPYQGALAGNLACIENMVHSCKKACARKALLKVILETGALQQPELILAVSRLAITAGADFLKTSTGKIATGATLEAVAAMLTAIQQAKHKVGLKVSGGIRTPQQAASYYQLAQTIMGETWISPGTFRFGASTLLDNLLAKVEKINH